MNKRSLIGFILLPIVVAAASVLMTVYFVNRSQSQIEHENESSGKYHCPMHPTYVSDKSGDCPICNMKLVPIEDPPGDQDDMEKTQTDGEHATVFIKPVAQQLIGVKTETITLKKLVKEIRAAGVTTHNERSTYNINLKFGGWIREVDCSVLTGKLIKRGIKLFSVYSPELISAQQEYLTALDLRRKATNEHAVHSADQLIDATKQKLVYWDMSEEQIEQVVNGGKSLDEVWILSPYEGFIIGDELTNGKYVSPGKNIFQIIDLSSLWVEAQIYEYEMQHIKEGDKVRVELIAFPNESFEGTVAYLFPELSVETRTIKVRIELKNPDFKLKVNMYGTVIFDIDLGSRLALPIDSVLDSGVRKIVFVKRNDNHFQPREVKLGARAGDYYELISGVADGEEIVTSANFLIDSESRLKASLNQMEGHKH